MSRLPEREEISCSERSKPAQVEVEASGTISADFSREVFPLERVREQEPEDKYWSIETRTRNFPPERPAKVTKPVRDSKAFGFSPSYF